MPPLRQAPTLILPGGNVVDDFHGGATGAVHGHVAHVTTRISLRAFFLLLVGTVVIFGLTIAVWHLGAFLRRFSRAKVVGAKTGPPQRYAKTWHGWVDLEKHQARERRRRHWAGRALVLLGLSKPHYRDAEVWHYGGAGFAPASGLAPPRAQAAPPVTPQQAAAIQVPVTTRASTAAPTLGLAHPYSQRVYHPVTRSGRQELLSRLHARLMHAGEVAREPLSTIRSNRSEPPALSAASLSPSGTCTSKQRATQQLHAQLPAASTPTPTPTPTRDPRTPRTPRTCRTASQSSPSLTSHADDDDDYGETARCRSARAHASESDQDALRCDKAVIIPRKRAGSAAQRRRRSSRSARQPPGASPIRQSSGRQSHTSFCDLARAYQAWAAKMQRSPPSDGPRPLSGVKGRPGTPVLRVLTASNLNQQGSVRATATQAPEAADTAQQLAATHTYYRYLTTSLHSAPLATHATQQRQRQRHASSRACATSLAFLGDANMDVETSSGNRGQRRESPKPSRLSILRRTLRKPRPPIRWPEPLLAAKARLATLDRSEVHLLYDLSKRLDWLCSELEPYRRPAQYLLIFNHWLNRKTWYVYDAPGRVPMQKRVEAALRRKGQKSRGGQEVALATESPGPPARADSHRAVTAEDSCARRRRRLQSWRIAVNVARHVARADSLKVRNGDAPAQASDPPDGALDPASWIIRRPPDGQSPAPRADTWYEGSGGLLQPYGRWQQVGGRPGRAIAGGDLLKRYHQVRAANSAATTDRGVAMAVRGAASRRTSATLVENVPPCEAVAGAPGPASASGVHTA